MKNLSLLNKEINERLQTKISNWISDIYDTMQNLIQKNKLSLVEVDINKLNKPEDYRFKFKDFMTDPSVKNIVNDKLIGFPIAAQMSKSIGRTMVDTTSIRPKNLDPECVPYWFTDEKNNIYFVGLVIFDPTVTYVDEFAHILDFEANSCVEDPNELLNAIYDDFTLHYLPERIAKFKGLTAKPEDPKLKVILQKLGFRSLKDNKDIYSVKI